ncbi:MAG: TlpA disulfide reductase family protein [Bacteroidales bacterium]|nr:TlpA disulfide reductase family protein [Bacteroidales bacterium]
MKRAHKLLLTCVNKYLAGLPENLPVTIKNNQMKKALSALLFLIGFTSLLASETIIDRPPFSVSNTSIVEIEKIVLTDTTTILYMKAYFQPNSWIRITSETYLRANGQKLGITKSKDIDLDKDAFMDDNLQKSFSLIFPPIDPKTKQIDFIEGDCEICFKIWGIELCSKTLSSRVETPQEIKNAAKIKDKNATLDIPKLEAGEAILKGQIPGYQAELNYRIKATVNNPVTGIQEEHETTVGVNGFFEMKIPLVCTTQIWFQLPSYNKLILLTPGKESSIYYDLQQKFMQEARLRIDKCRPNRYIYFDGANADMNNQLSSNEAVLKNGYLILSKIAGMTAGEFKTYILNELEQDIKNLEKKGLTPEAFSLGKLTLQNKAISKLTHADNYLESAFRSANKVKREDRLRGYDEPVMDATYFSFLRDLPVNDPKSLYCGDYYYTINSCKYLIYKLKGASKSLYTADVPETLIKTQQLTPEEKKCAEYFIEQDIRHWNKRKIAKFRDAVLGLCNQLTDKATLTAYKKKELAVLKAMSTDKESNVQDLFDKQFLIIRDITKSVTIPFEAEKYINRINNINKPDSALLVRYNTLSTKYKDLVQDIVNNRNEQENIHIMENILGTNQGIAFDLMKVQQKCRQIQDFIPLSEKTFQEIASMDMPFYGIYLRSKKQELLAKIEANKKLNGYTVHDVPSVPNEELFAELLKPYAGKVILVDFWATWCGPCREAMKQMEPAKKSFMGKDVVFMYLSNESSPLTTWQNMIPGIPGEHYRLTKDQYTYLSKKFGVLGIPSYLILNKKGQQVYFKVGFEGSEKIFGLLNNELKK